jgi:hypothetical protein
VSEPQHGFSFPCYSILNADCVGSVAIARDRDSFTTVLFTSDANVKRFKAAGPVRFGPTVRFEGLHELLFYLDALPPTVTHFAIDPERPGGEGITVPAAAMREELRRRLDDESLP